MHRPPAKGVASPVLLSPLIGHVTVRDVPTRRAHDADVAGCLFRVSGPALWERMQNSWGYLATGGYRGHVFPVVIGETGSLYTSVSPTELWPSLA